MHFFIHILSLETILLLMFKRSACNKIFIWCWCCQSQTWHSQIDAVFSTKIIFCRYERYICACSSDVSNNNTQLIFLFAWLESCVVFCCCSFLINYSFEFELDSEIWSTDVNHPQMEINERYTILLFGCFFTKPFLMHS